MAQGSQGSSPELFNVISVFFLALSAFVCIISLLILGDIVPAGPLEPATDVPPPTSVLVNNQLPTATPSDTPQPTSPELSTRTPTPSLTWTPFPTRTSTPTRTPTETPIPSATNTFTPSPTVTMTPSLTFTPSATPTLQPDTATPTTSAVQVLFQVQPNMPIYRDAFLHPGCEWLGAGGQITGQNGEPLVGLTVRITGPNGSSVTQVTGTNTNYGASGWEAQLANAPAANVYTVEVMSADLSRPLSNPITLSFDGTCERNLGLVNFTQVPPEGEQG